MATAIKAPDDSDIPTESVCIFLAGSIDGGKAEDWQLRLTADLHNREVTLFNPRRDRWDDTWEQSITNPNFHGQVLWEMNHLDRADIIVMYFDPNGKAPITLLELGLHATRGNIIICCPDGYWRKGNVEVIADEFGLVLTNTYEDLMRALDKELKTYDV